MTKLKHGKWHQSEKKKKRKTTFKTFSFCLPNDHDKTFVFTFFKKEAIVLTFSLKKKQNHLSQALELVMGGSGLSQKVAANTARFRQGMSSAGFQIMGENHPICPVFLGDAKLAATMAEKMLGKKT